MKNKTIAAALVVALALSSLMVAISSADGVAADGPFTIKDVNGNDVSFDKSANNVITLGLGLTLTVIELGMKNKIVGVDMYSAPGYASNAPFKDTLEGLEDLGNYYNAGGREQIITSIIQMIDSGKFKSEDLVILAPNYSYIVNDTDGLIKMIAQKGLDFRVVLLAKSGMMFDDIIPFVENIGKITGASNIGKVVSGMNKVKSEVEKVVTEEGLSGASAIHLSSSTTPTLYNSSILLSMVNIAGGVNVGGNGSSSASYTTDYAAIVQIVEQNPNVVIFIDGGNPDSVSEFKNKIGNPPNAKVLKMDPTFNNTAPSVSEGLWEVACALYPEHFSGDIPSDDSDNGNIYLYLAVGILVVVIIVGATVYLLRKKSV